MQLLIQIVVIFNGSNYEQSLLHIFENIVPEAVSDAEMMLHTMICCRGIKKWDGRRRLIVDGYAFSRMDLAELLEYVVLPYHKDTFKPQSLDIFTQGLACTGAEPRQKGSQCIRLPVETRNNAQNGMELEYDSQEEPDADSLVVEPDLPFPFIRRVTIFL